MKDDYHGLDQLVLFTDQRVKFQTEQHVTHNVQRHLQGDLVDVESGLL